MKLDHLAILSASTVAADFLGATYPPPKDLTSNSSLVHAAWENITSIYDAYLKDGSNTTSTKDIAGSQNVTFSAGLLSIYDADASNLQYHYTAPQVRDSQNGTKSVDGDSVYRVASVSKLMTVFAGLLGIDEARWNEPVTRFVPELVSNNSDSKNAPNWNDITLWALASHMGGIQPTGPIADILLLALAKGQAGSLSEYGVPPPSQEALQEYNVSLASGPASKYFSVAGSAPPAFPPYYTPAYSNLGMMILGKAISRITKKPYDKLYQDLIFDSLNMTSSFANAPTSGSVYQDRAVIPNGALIEWNIGFNTFTVPTGGILSTLNDLNKLGIGILKHTLLCAVRTRKWMKPQTHTASMSYSFGAPWEIVRYLHQDTGKVTDIYGKLGDSGSYGALVALIPEYGAGFTFMNAQAGNEAKRGEIALRLINVIAETIVPALENQAKLEAESNFLGTYSSTDVAVNSSLTLIPNPTKSRPLSSGLFIKSWISNGTDMLEGSPARLFYTTPSEDEGKGQAVFQSSSDPQWPTYQAAGMGPYSGFYDSNFGWARFEDGRYAGESFSTFRFGVDKSGRAVSVWNDATRLEMKREDES